MENESDEWIDLTVLFRKWERISSRRKQAHYKASNIYGRLNKLFSLPIILISTILGSLSFIHPSFIDQSTSSSSRLLYSRSLQTSVPTMSPTSACVWEKYDEDDLIDDYPYCDNSIVKYNNDYYKSTLTSANELLCDRNVNFVGNTAYYQFPVAAGITTQSEAEVWCVGRDEGHGIFYQNWPDGQIICMVLEESPNNIIYHGHHTFGGVCISSGLLDNPTQTYIYNCGNQVVIDIYNGNCSLVESCAASCSGILGGYENQLIGFYDCACCYNYWQGCSWGQCSGLIASNSDTPISSPVTSPTEYTTYSPTSVPTKSPTSAPTNVPTDIPTKVPTDVPTKVPTDAPTYAPTYAPTKIPTRSPTYAPTNAPTKSPIYNTENNSDGTSNTFTYIIGGFNMLIAVLSALHTFLKYDTLEDRHHQYSRHFGALQVDIETLLAKPRSQRGNAITVLENYKTQYAVLINNAPDLSERSELWCSETDVAPAQIELT